MVLGMTFSHTDVTTDHCDALSILNDALNLHAGGKQCLFRLNMRMGLAYHSINAISFLSNISRSFIMTCIQQNYL